METRNYVLRVMENLQVYRTFRQRRAAQHRCGPATRRGGPLAFPGLVSVGPGRAAAVHKIPAVSVMD
jgi:hypothetical protein